MLMSKGLVAESRLENAEQGHETHSRAAKLTRHGGTLKPMLAVLLQEVGVDRRLAVAMIIPVLEWEDVDTAVASFLMRKQCQNLSRKGAVESPDGLASREIGMFEQKLQNFRHVLVCLVPGEVRRLIGK